MQFAAASVDALEFLHAHVGLDLWLVTQVVDDRQHVVASVPDAGPVPAGTVLSWSQSLCRRMVAGGPRIAPDVRAEPAYADLTGDAAAVRAYAGVPLLTAGRELFGTLCGYGLRAPADASLLAHEPLMPLLGSLLSRVLAQEELAASRLAEVARAEVAAERDALTGLLNRRGWLRLLDREEQRCARHALTASVVVLDVDDLKQVNDAGGHLAGDLLLRSVAAALSSVSRPEDVVARLGGDEFAVLAVECDGAGAHALVHRLTDTLDAQQLHASVGVATRGRTKRPSHSGPHALEQAVVAADLAMYADKGRRHRLRADAVGEPGPQR